MSQWFKIDLYFTTYFRSPISSIMSTVR